MLGRPSLATWPPETDQVPGDGTVAPLPVGLPLAVVLHHALPGAQERRDAPAPLRECGPGSPHGRCTETTCGECRKDGAATLEQASAEQRPQEVEKAQSGPQRDSGNHARHNVTDTVEEG
jgi:hypothetical protein